MFSCTATIIDDAEIYLSTYSSGYDPGKKKRTLGGILDRYSPETVKIFEGRMAIILKMQHGFLEE